MAALNVLSLMLYIDEIRIILQHGVLHILALNKTRLDLSIPNEYALSLLLGSCRLSEFILAGPV